jgi:hypothetical protein
MGFWGGKELGLLGFRGGSESRVLRLAGDEDWGWGFFLAAARAPDMRASKAEGREDMATELGLAEEKGWRYGEREKGLVGKREKERVLRGRESEG